MQALIAFKNPKVDSPSACHQGLGVTALNTVMALRELRLEADALPISNGEYLWAQLEGPWAKYTHVCLEAPFIDAPFLGKLFAQYPDKKFSLIYHSNLGFLAQDSFAGQSLPLYDALQREAKNFTLAGNSIEFTQAIEEATGTTVRWLPNLYHLPNQPRRSRAPWRIEHTLNIGLFGGCRILKNWLTAGAAAMIVARNLGTNVALHISAGRDEGAGATRACLEALVGMNRDVTLVEIPWLSHDDFLRQLYGMDLLLQPSFTETFNNVTADGCYCGVPSVVSDAIDWAPSSWLAKADSAVDVAGAAVRVLRDPGSAAHGWAALNAYNVRANKAWMQWLN